MKIVVLDGYTENPGDLSWEELEKLGELTVYDRTPPELVISRIGDAEAIYVNKVKIGQDIIDACPNLRFIGVLATGYNIIDTEAAKQRGIIVCNVPSYGTDAVAQFAIALLLEVCHHIQRHSDAVYDGRWTKNKDWCFWDHPLIELSGKTMGIIGFGCIGQRVAQIAQAFGMKILAYDTHKDLTLVSENCQYTDLDTLLESSEVISLHCPLFPETEGIINKETIAKMKDGVIIINNSRGPLIVESDLAEALETGKVYAAALDVVSQEPINKDNPLLAAPNCLITPHISWASKESRERLMNIAVDDLRQFLAGTPINVVNL